MNLPAASPADSTTTPADVTLSLSRQILQFALDAYADEHFVGRLFEQPKLGLVATGRNMRLELGQQQAAIALALEWNFLFSVGEWMGLRTEPHEVRAAVGVSFTVRDGRLFLALDESSIQLEKFEKLGVFLKSMVNSLTASLRQRPLLALPIQMELGGSQAQGTDETALQLTALDVRPEGLGIAFQLRHDSIPLPPWAAEKRPNSRARAARLVQQGAQCFGQGDAAQAAAYFARACLQADPSYELGWMWLAAALGDSAEQAYCLRRTIAINPENRDAIRALAALPPVADRPPRLEDHPLRAALGG